MIKHRKNRIGKSKKGEEMLLDFIAIAIFAVIILLFFFLFSHERNANEKKIQSESIVRDANFMLESFLRAPATGTGTGKTVGEIIVEDSVNNNFDNTKKLFDSFFKDMDYYHIVLRVEGIHSDTFKKSDYNSLEEYSESETYLPGPEKKVYVKLSVRKNEYVSFTLT